MESLRSHLDRILTACLQHPAIAIFLRGTLLLVSPLWPAPHGLLEFRLGNVTRANQALNKSKLALGGTKQWQERSAEILDILSERLPLRSSPQWTTLPFNNRILFACHSSGHFHPNGYAMRTAHLAANLTKAGAAVRVVTRPGYPDDLGLIHNQKAPSSSIFLGVEHHHLSGELETIRGPELSYITAYAEKLEHAAKAHNATAIHAHSPYQNGIAASIAAEKLGIICVYEARGLWHETRAVAEPGFRDTELFEYSQRMETAAASACHVTITISSGLKNWFMKRGVTEEKIKIIPNSYDVTELSPPKASIRNQDKLRLGFVGSLTKYEGLEFVMRAMSKSDVPVTLDIAGNGTHCKDLRKVAKSLGISELVRFRGSISHSDAVELLSEIDLMVLCRTNSILTQLVPPLKLVEAMALGVPVMVSRLEALEEVVGGREQAVLVEPENSTDIKNALSKIQGDRKYLETLRNNAHARCKAKYGWAQAVALLHEAYGNIPE